MTACERRHSHEKTIVYLLTTDVSSLFLRGQLAFLMDNGFTVVVGANLRSDSPEALFDAGTTLVHLPFEREPTPLKDLAALVATIRLLRRLRPQLINASTPKAGLIGMLASFLTRVPRRVYVVRGLRFETSSGVRRLILKAFEFVAIRLSTEVLFNSPSSLRVARENRLIGTSRGRVLARGSGNGIDVDRFSDRPSRAAARQQLGLDQDASVIAFVGRLTKSKGVPELVQAFRQRRLDAATLLLVGDHEAGDQLDDATTTAIAVDPRILHKPFMSDVGLVYAAADLIAFPSHREGLPNVPLEAQLCGVPVVGFAATGTLDAVESGTGGILVPVGDVQALGDSLADLLDNDVLRRQMGAAGEEWVRKYFRREVVWDALLDVYLGGSKP